MASIWRGKLGTCISIMNSKSINQSISSNLLWTYSSAVFIRQHEDGFGEIATSDVLLRICAALKCDVSDIMEILHDKENPNE